MDQLQVLTQQATDLKQEERYLESKKEALEDGNALLRKEAARLRMEVIAHKEIMTYQQICIDADNRVNKLVKEMESRY